MSTHLIDVATALSMYAVMAVAFYGWGYLGAALLKLKTPTLHTPFTLIWLGWAISLLALQIIHLLVPIDFIISFLIYGVGGALSLLLIVYLLRRRRTKLNVYLLLFVGILLLLAYWAASRSMLPPTVHDSGLYHFNSVRWNNLFPVIPGLGNLHSRLAFNQTYFSYVASLNFFPYFPHGRSIANSFLLLLLFSEAVWRLLVSIMRRSYADNPHPFLYLPHLFMLPILCFLAMVLHSRGLTSPTPDYASTLLQLGMFFLFVQVIYDLRTGTWNHERGIVLTVLAVTAVTLKLSNLGFSLVLIGVCFLCFFRFSPDRKRLVQTITPLVVLCVTIGGVWIARGYILSGYPLFPSPIGGLSVDWAVPLESVQELEKRIYSWARFPLVHWSEVPEGWGWLESWFRRELGNEAYTHYAGIAYPVITTLFALLLVLGIVLRAYLKKKPLPRLVDFLLLLLPVVSLTFWFFTAPIPRFARAAFLLLPLSLVLILLSYFHAQLRARSMAVVICAAFLVTNLFLIRFCLLQSNAITSISTTGFYPVKTVPLQQQRTPSGQRIYTSTENALCWDSPVPCTPALNPRLDVREAGRLESGFTVTKGQGSE